MKFTKEISKDWHFYAWNPWLHELDIRHDTIEEGYVKASLVNDPKYCAKVGHGQGRIFGGVILALTDVVAYEAAMTSNIYVGGSLTQDSSFLREARGEMFTIESTVTKWGKTITHVETIWKNDEDKRVFQALSTFTMLSHYPKVVV